MNTTKQTGSDSNQTQLGHSGSRAESASNDLDLSRLALDRRPTAGPSSASRPNSRKWITRYLIPGVILFGFAGLIIAAAGNAFLPKHSVQVVPVIVKRGVAQQSGETLFQAAGWIEPRPTPTKVPSLASGAIEELLVVEGQSVKKGDPIARLISIDAEIGVKQANAALEEAEAKLGHAQAQLRAAQTRFEKPIHLQLKMADAKSELAKTQRELANLPHQIESAEARLKFAQQSVAGKRKAGEAIPKVVLEQAESELASAQAELRELQKRQPSLQRELNALQEKLDATQAQLNLMVDETRQLDEAKASVRSATALRDAAALRIQKAELNLERNTIRAPIDGRILRLVASPGMRVSGLDSNSGPESSIVVEMYDPKKLQIRADVRLEDVPLVQPGQPVEIETASSPVTIKGLVLQSNSSANIQKNTLEVKVELIDPPDSVRPEMLVTATFLALEVEQQAADEKQETERIFIPGKLVQSAGNGNFAWIVDQNNRARKVNLKLSGDTNGELVEVVSGLKITDKLIASDTGELTDGSLVKVTGEESTIGR